MLSVPGIESTISVISETGNIDNTGETILIPSATLFNAIICKLPKGSTSPSINIGSIDILILSPATIIAILNPAFNAPSKSPLATAFTISTADSAAVFIDFKESIVTETTLLAISDTVFSIAPPTASVASPKASVSECVNDLFFGGSAFLYNVKLVPTNSLRIL